MLEYFVLDWRDFELPVYPVLVLSHAAGAHSFPLPVTVTFPDRRVLEFDFPVIKLTALDAKAHALLHNTAALAFSSAMKIGRTERIALGVEMVCSLDVMTVDGLVRDAVTGFFFAKQLLSQSETLKFREELSKISPVKRRERITQWTNPWIEEGIEKGMQLGRRGAGRSPAGSC